MATRPTLWWERPRAKGKQGDFVRAKGTDEIVVCPAPGPRIFRTVKRRIKPSWLKKTCRARDVGTVGDTTTKVDVTSS